MKKNHSGEQYNLPGFGNDGKNPPSPIIPEKDPPSINEETEYEPADCPRCGLGYNGCSKHPAK